MITLFSRIGREFFNFTVPPPFGLRDDVFQLILSLPAPVTGQHRGAGHAHTPGGR